MNKQLRQIIKEEVYRVMMEMGEEDPIKLAQDMVKSNEEQVKSLELELKYKEADIRVSGLPRDMKDARAAEAKVTKDRLEQSKLELELAKQSLINAATMQSTQNSQTSQSSQISQDSGQSQIQPQI